MQHAPSPPHRPATADAAAGVGAGPFRVMCLQLPSSFTKQLQVSLCWPQVDVHCSCASLCLAQTEGGHQATPRHARRGRGRAPVRNTSLQAHVRASRIDATFGGPVCCPPKAFLPPVGTEPPAARAQRAARSWRDAHKSPAWTARTRGLSGRRRYAPPALPPMEPCPSVVPHESALWELEGGA